MIKDDIRELVDKYATAKTKKAEEQLDQLVDALVDLVDDLRAVRLDRDEASAEAGEQHDFGNVVVHTGADGTAFRVDLPRDTWSISEYDLLETTNVVDHTL